MNRPRNRDRHLPACVYQKHGAYYYVKRGKWLRIGSNLHEALQAYARIVTHAGGIQTIINRVLSDADVKPQSLRKYRYAAATIIESFERGTGGIGLDRPLLPV